MAAVGGPPAETISPAQHQSYFEIVTSNLLKLGALTLEDFLRDPYQEPAPPESFLSNPLYHDVPIAPSLAVNDNDGEGGKPAQTPAPIFVLHQICSQVFGSINALDYEIIEEEGKEKKRCILTITRPNGATRSYTSKPEFARKAEARAAAAAIAVDMGAIDFIKHGSPEAVAKRGLVLAPLDAPGSVQEPSPRDAEEDPAVKEIEKCCVEWRAGRVKPRWIFLIDSKPTGKYGCALQIKLSPHLFRVFSVDVMYPAYEAAKATCAADAIAEGILDFIKFGNGQTAPAERRLFQPQEDDEVFASPPVTLTLQGFFEALPRPLPEPVDDKTVAEINAPGWLNTLIQSARGAKFEHKFIWTTETQLGTHGAVLRLTRPGEVRTYMVEPQFPKRADAKNAVCLAALAAGVGDYVRSITGALETKISPEIRTLVLDSILPLLTTEYAKFWPNKLPDMFEYTRDRDACGCNMMLKFIEHPEEHEKRCWTVPADFRSRNDAKVAVIQLAFEQGAIEFLRFRGEPPPEGYKVDLPAPREPKKAKRKGGDGAENEGGEGIKKKPKLLSQAEQFLAATLPAKPTEVLRASGLPSKPSQPPPATSAPAMFLPRPGYIDSKPEPGELPAEPPSHEPEYFSTKQGSRWPAAAHSLRETGEYGYEYPPRRTAESSFYHRPRGGGGSRLAYPYDTREHGGQYEHEHGDPRYDGPGVPGYASDPYYELPPPPPAPHVESCYSRPSVPAYGEEDEYRRSSSYYDVDYYGRDYDHDYAHDYDYEWEDRYAAAPPPPPLAPVSMPGNVPAHGWADFERSGYDYNDYGYAHAHERGYTDAYGHIPHPHPHPPSPPPPPAQPPAELAISSSMSAVSRRGPLPPHPLPSAPRIWEPGPRAAEVDARRSAVLPPRPPRPPPELLPRASAPAAAAATVTEPWAVPELVTALSSSSSTPTSPLPNAMKRKLSATTTSTTTSSKEELFEYCEAHGYPHPQFFDAADDSGNAINLGATAAPNAVAAGPHAARYKVWVVLGEERLELPTSYAGIKEGEEKMARKVLRHLRSRDMGEVPE